MPRPAQPHPYRKTITRWLSQDGKQVKAGTSGARKIQRKTATYYADLPGIGTRSLKTVDLAVAWKRLGDLLRQQHQRDLGVHDRYSDHALVPLAEHLKAWLDVLEAKGTGEQQRDTVRRRLTNLFALGGWSKLADLDADKTLAALAKLQKGAKDGKRGRSAATRNHYLTHLRGFCAWLVKSGRLPSNPIAAVEKINAATDRRHRRRCPDRAEIAELLRWLESPQARVRKGTSGACRALAYKTAMATGYRAGELRSLSRACFDLDGAVVTLPAAVDKRRRGARQPLPAWLVEELRSWFAAGGALWENFPAAHSGRLLRADLDAARRAWIAAGGAAESDFLSYRVETADGPLFWDMHAFRVFYISELAHQPGIDLKTLMTLARHSTPQLSLGVYARAREEHLRAAIDNVKPFDKLIE